MKTNTVLPLIATLAALCAPSCGNPEQKIRLKVTDEDGKPIKGAACMACWWKDVFARGTTNAHGIVEFTERTPLAETYVEAELPGYYPSRCYKFLMDTSKGKPGARWEPWPVELNFVMKRIVRPHPMYFWTNEGGQYSQIFFPNNDFKSQHGYDLLSEIGFRHMARGKSSIFSFPATMKRRATHPSLPNPGSR